MKKPTIKDYSTILPSLYIKRDDIDRRISVKKIECAEIRLRMSKNVPDQGNDHLNRVNELLGRPSLPVVDPDEARLRALLIELTDLQAARAALDAAILAETRIASNKLLEAVKPDALRLGGIFAKAFIALRLAHAEYNSFVDEVESTGANVESLRLHINGLSDPADASGNYPWGIRAFADAGLISKSQAPQAI